jgi:hypothetical protein
MIKPLTYFSVLGLVVCGALVHGAVTQRWQVFVPNTELTNRLHAQEIRLLDWQPTEVPTDMPVNERSTATSRRYDSASAKRTAVVSLISGIPGSVATHTPDVCYPGSGYRTLRGPRRENITAPDGSPTTGTAYVADFEKRTQTKFDRVRVRWAWTTDGTWVAPDNPRWQFAGQLRAPTLYKVYIATPLPDTPDDDPAEDTPSTKAFVAETWAQYSATFGR